jgi:hypothetical protein
MNGLLNWLAGRRAARIAVVALLFVLPLLAVASAALVIVTTIASGWRLALQDCAAALLLLAALALLIGGGSTGIVAGAAVTWLVAIGLGQLKRAGSLTLAVQTVVLAGAAVVVGFVAWSRDAAAYWEDVLRDFTERARTAGLDVGPADIVPGIAQVMTGMMAASAVASAMAALFLGSWWAAGPGRGRFGAEFQAVRMGRVIGAIAGVVGLLFLTSLKATADDLLLVLAVGFVVQGLAVVHWHGARRGWPRAWPLALYLPLALVPALAAIELLLLALLGLADNGFGLRRGRQLV